MFMMITIICILQESDVIHDHIIILTIMILFITTIIGMIPGIMVVDGA